MSAFVTAILMGAALLAVAKFTSGGPPRVMEITVAADSPETLSWK